MSLRGVDGNSRSPDQLHEDAPSPGRRPVSLLACTSCRHKHLKCDGKSPSCSRCRRDGRHCRYMPSRRGYKDPEKSGKLPSNVIREVQDDVGATNNSIRFSTAFAQETNASELAGTVALGWGMQTPSSLNTSHLSPLPWPSRTQFSLPPDSYGDDYVTKPSYDLDFVLNDLTGQSNINSLLPSRYEYNALTSKRFLEEYYLHFHAAHPILLPLHHRTKALVQSYPQYLLSTIHCIGSQYVLRALNDDYRNAITRMLTSQADGDGYLVQAMLIFTITLHAQGQQQEARQMLGAAIDLVLKLGMHRMAFASNNGKGCLMLEESWRRTWWELYVVDGMLAALHQETTFRLNKIVSDVPLPCEEIEYTMCETISRTATADRVKNRVFIEDGLVISSFALRVEAIRILGQILTLRSDTSERDKGEFEAIESSLTSWKLTLPVPKRPIVSCDGTVDEMLFQANMIHNASVVYLHQPVSTMAPPPVTANVPCANLRRTDELTTAQHVHLIKTIKAANKLLHLITIPGSPNDHSPFFICGVALGAMVKLSACSMNFTGTRADLIREQIILAIGALSFLGETWAVALPIAKEVKRVARHVFNIGTMNTNLALNGVNGEAQTTGGVLLDDISWQDQADIEWSDI